MSAVARSAGDRFRVLADGQWELLGLLLPKSEGWVGRNFAKNRLVVEGMLYRLRTSSPWRDLPEVFGVDWVASIDSTVVRVHQHGGGARGDSVSGL
jgi:hypothetical protein